MKILFMGTPDFAASMLESLVKGGYDVIGAVSQPDKPKGRGHKLMPTDVKLKAEEYDIPVYQPETLKNGSFKDQLDELSPDLIVVAAYGKILPDYVIDYPRMGCINVHPSLLPRYRGAAPIQRAIINGDEKTGVCIMCMDYGLDTGDIILRTETNIGEYETSGELFERMAQISGKLLCEAVDAISAGKANYTKQPDDGATYASMIKKSEAEIDWSRPASEISKLICGMNPYPLAFTSYKGNTLKIAEAVKTEADGKPGEILGIEKGKGLLVSCGSGALYLKTVQFAGSKRMNVEDYARGHEIETGAILGE